MAVTSNRSVDIQLTGEVTYSQTFDGVTNTSGSGQNQKISLSSGNNTITVPSGAVAVTIIKPSGNTVQVTLKGVNGDTGIALSLVSPDSISLNSVSTFVLNASGPVTVRLIYS